MTGTETDIEGGEEAGAASAATDEAQPRVDGAQSQPDPLDDYGEPFEARSFGGQFIWAQAQGYTAKILRVRAGEKVIISTTGRKDMTVMLTGGRGILEIIEGKEAVKVELEPAAPIEIDPEREFRLVAMTDVELFTIHSPLPPAEDDDVSDDLDEDEDDREDDDDDDTGDAPAAE